MCNIIYNIIYIVHACGISGAILSPTYHDIPIYSETNGRRGWTVAAVARFPRRRPNCPEPRKRRNGSTGRRCLPRSRWGRSRKEQTPFERFIMLNHVESCSSFYALLDLVFAMFPSTVSRWFCFFQVPNWGLSHGGQLARWMNQLESWVLRRCFFSNPPQKKMCFTGGT